MKLYEYSAAELSEMLMTGKCSSAEIAYDVSGRIKEAEPAVGAYITLNDSMLRDAELIDNARSRGDLSHPLSGIPIAVKDNISTAGMRTTCASRMLSSYIPPYDAHAVDCLHRAGSIVTGKTNMDEFAMGSATDTSFFHPTYNPIDTAYSAGGSSGGSAAAVCAGEAILALGSDTGGSVRQPASFCGIVGFKPAYGAVSRRGLIAFAPSLEQIGVMGKTVRDAELLYQLISENDSMDPMMRTCSCKHSSSLRIGVPKELFDSTIVSDECREASFSALRLLETDGAALTEISVSKLRYAANIYYVISSAEASSELARYDGVRYGHRSQNAAGLESMYVKSRTEGFGDEVKRRIMLGTFVLSEGSREAYYLRALAAMRELRHELDAVFDSCDIIAAPTYPRPPFSANEAQSTTDKYSADICTVPANLAGLPALSVPCGKAKNGLPVGIQLMSPAGAEQRLFAAAKKYEELCGGFAQFRGGSGYAV